jgi:hypothetical protein
MGFVVVSEIAGLFLSFEDAVKHCYNEEKMKFKGEETPESHR